MPGEPAPVVRRRVPLGEFSRPGRPARRTGGRRTWLVAVTLSVAVGAAAGLGIGVVLRSAQDEAGGGAGPAAPPRAGTAAPAGVGTAAPGGEIEVPAGLTLIAQLSRDVPRFAAPGDGRPVGTVPGSWHGAPSALPVVETRPGWLRVRLAQRPNGDTAWIRAGDATLATSQYRIEVDLAVRRLRVYDRGERVLDVPAGVGTADHPTPTGEFFLALFAPPPAPGFGEFVVVTSAHSETITDWDSSGDAIVGIHGPLGADAEIGTTGATVSHGCVRLHMADLARLRHIPAGTPIAITDSGR